MFQTCVSYCCFSSTQLRVRSNLCEAAVPNFLLEASCPYSVPFHLHATQSQLSWGFGRVLPSSKCCLLCRRRDSPSRTGQP